MKSKQGEKIGNIIICGAPRAGTTSMFRYLSHHPNIVSSSVKELNYFLGGSYKEDNYNDQYNSRKKYNKCFKQGINGKWTLEASPAYMHPCYLPQVAVRIKETSPDARLIMLIRSPIDRLYSEFQGRKVREGNFPEDFSFFDFTNMLIQKEAPSIYGVEQSTSHLLSESLMVSSYVDVITQYLEYFDSKQIKLVFTESLAKNPKQEVMSVCAWLSLPVDVYSDYQFKIENRMISAKSKGLYRVALRLNTLLEPILSKAPYIRESLREMHNWINANQANQINKTVQDDRLNDFFKPYNVRLRKLIKEYWPSTELPEWLKGR